jgi:hypothetical protein
MFRKFRGLSSERCLEDLSELLAQPLINHEAAGARELA